MEKKRTDQTVKITVIAAALVVVILILGTIWTGRSAQKDTVNAVRSVSSLYLDELAGRREQVVEDNLNNNINLIDIAVGMIEEKDLTPELLAETVNSLLNDPGRREEMRKNALRLGKPDASVRIIRWMEELVNEK